MFNIVNFGLKFAFFLWQKKSDLRKCIIIIIIIVVVVVVIYLGFAPSTGPVIYRAPDKLK